MNKMLKKKLLFYSALTSGHLNVCSAIGSILLNNYPDEIEIYFIADQKWAENLKAIDSRFKIGLIDLNEEGDRIKDIVKQTENCLNLSFIERRRINEIDKKASEQIKLINPDFILCDQIIQLPAMIEHNIPHGFIVSTNPTNMKIEGFPYSGSDSGIDEKEKIKQFNDEFSSFEKKLIDALSEVFEKRNVKIPKNLPVHLPRSEFLSIYNYPKELDYYDEEIKKKFNLLRIDSAVISTKVPDKYQLPEEFSKLSGKIIYVSLGTLFSYYHTKLQKLIDMLATLPYKYIVSKGPNGNKIKFPNNRFIGENFVNQLAVLQIADMMIAHGGNNTFTECFYFGVPSLILPVMGDQITNAKRIEETGFGHRLDLANYNVKELEQKIESILNDDSLKEKYKKISQRIKDENSLEVIVSKIMTFMKNKPIEKLSF